MTGGTRPNHIARAALEAIAWRVADVLAVVSEQVTPETLRVDGGLTQSELLMQMQADTAGVTVEYGVVDATAAGAAALAAVGAGIWPSIRTIAEKIPIGDRVEPQRDDAWRSKAHAEWRSFVEKAAEL
jgi:glycerol kinase